MNRIKKRNKNNLMILIIVYFLILSTISIAYSFLSEQLIIKGKSSFNSVGNNDYDFKYNYQNKWEENNLFNYMVDSVITYKGNDNIVGWKLNIWIPANTEVVGCYNASICTINENTLTIVNATYNGILNVNNNTVLIKTHLRTELSNYEIRVLGIEFIKEGSIVPNPGTETITGVNTSINLVSDWGNKKYYTIDITNNYTKNILSFKITILIPDDAIISNIWGVEYIHKGNNLILSGPSWNLGINTNSYIQGNIMYDTSSSTNKFEILYFEATLEDGKQVEIKI